jgi:small conductance mechanosensitive channel
MPVSSLPWRPWSLLRSQYVRRQVMAVFTAMIWFDENGLSILFQVMLFIVILFGFWVLSRFVQRIVRRTLEMPNVRLSKLLSRMIVSVAKNLVFLAGVLVALSQLGISVGPLLAGFGVAGFILGFALQETLSNFASEMMILIYRPFDVGDILEAGGVYGRVNRMSLVNTTFLTLDNQTLIVPNNKIWGDIIKNVTAQDIRRVDMIFGVSYSDDIPKTERILREIVTSSEKVLSDPEPMIHLHELGDSSVNFVVRPWAKTEDYWDVYWEIHRKVKMGFDQHDISIPFPQRDVHLIKENVPDTSVETAAREEKQP